MQRLFPAVIPEMEHMWHIWRDFYVGISVSIDLRCTDEHSGGI